VRFELSTNYRSTRPIIEFARNILAPYTKDFMPESINRKGEQPAAKMVSSADDVVSGFLSDIKEDVKILNKSIGVICYEKSLFDRITTEMKKIIKNKENLVILDSGTRVNYIPKGVYVMDAENSKGLEFSKVYVLGLNPGEIKTFEEARRAFVVTTRAMNELVIYGVREHEKTNRKD